MAITRSHENAVVVTPQTLKHQIITRIYTLVSKSGGSYYPEDEGGSTKPITNTMNMEVHGLETNGRGLYLVGIPNDETISIDLDKKMKVSADEFFIEELWEVYMGCEPLYQSRFADYGTFQDV